MRSLTRVVPVITQALKKGLNSQFFHSNVGRLAPRIIEGKRYWPDEDLQNRYRQGFEDAKKGLGASNGGSTSSDSSQTMGFTEADVKAALEEGMKQADQYLGGAVRGAWSDGHAQGKILGSQEEKENLKVEIEKAASKAHSEGFAKGLAENPAKQTIEKEGYEKGWQAGLKEAKEVYEKDLTRTKAKILEEERHNQKLTTKAQNQFNKVKNLFRKDNSSQNSNTIAEKHFSLKDIRELPLLPFRTTLWRPGFRPENYAGLYGDTTYDQFRVKDLFKAKFINPKTGERRFVALLLLFGTALGISAFTILRKYLAERKKEKEAEIAERKEEAEAEQIKKDQYLFGEDREQYQSRKKIEQHCQSLATLNPKDFDTDYFTPEEQKFFQEDREKCLKAQEYQQHMKREMEARRKSGYGDQKFFGLRKLDGIYKDREENDFSYYSYKSNPPVLDSLVSSRNKVFSRARDELYQKKLKDEAEKAAKKKEIYEKLLSETEKPQMKL